MERDHKGSTFPYGRELWIIIFGFLAALFIQHGFRSIYDTLPSYLQEHVFWAQMLQNSARYIAVATMVLWIFQKKKGSLIGAAIICVFAGAMLLICCIIYRFKIYMFVRSAGDFIFAILLLTEILRPTHVGKKWIVPLVFAGVSFAVSTSLTMFDAFDHDFIGLASWFAILDGGRREGIASFFFRYLPNGGYGMPVFNMLDYYPYSFSLQFCTLVVCSIAHEKVADVPLQDRIKNHPAYGCKSRTTAALLAGFIGNTGAHRYYLGYTGLGLLQSFGYICILLGIFWGYVVLRTGDGLVPAVIFIVLGSANSIWVLVDFIRILVNGLQPQNGSYHKQNHYSAPAQPSNPQNQLEALERLAKLHERGIITDEEFEQKKAEFLSKA